MKNSVLSLRRHAGQLKLLLSVLPVIYSCIRATALDKRRGASHVVFRIPFRMHTCPQQSLPYRINDSNEPPANDKAFRATDANARKYTAERGVHSLLRNRNLSTPTATSKFKLHIFHSPSSAHEIALNYCAYRASHSWISSKEVRVKITFIDTFDDVDTLGDSRASSGWFMDGHAYTVAMLKSILETDLNAQDSGENRYDIIVRLNSHAKWYLGTDKLPGHSTYDLVTVCLHELYHGLMSSSGNIEVVRSAIDGKYRGRFVKNEFMWRYDAFLAVGTAVGDCALSSYKGEYRALGDALTSNNLWFRGAHGRAAQLHAPQSFEHGNSVYHLADGAYGVEGNRNRLMTPAIHMRYANHDVGPLMRKMQALMLNRTETGAPICQPPAWPIMLERRGVQTNLTSQAAATERESRSAIASPTGSPRFSATLSRSPSPTASRIHANFLEGPTVPQLQLPYVSSAQSPDPSPSKILLPTAAPFTSTLYPPSISSLRPSASGRSRAPNPSSTKTPLRTVNPVAVRTPHPAGSHSRAPPSASSSASTSPTGSPSLSPSPTRVVTDGTATCFPNSGIVELEAGGMIEVSRLRVGDRVRTGPNSFSDVFLFTHKDYEIWAEFIRIEVSSNNVIEMSKGHFISASRVLKSARNVRIGDSIRLVDGKEDVVTSIRKVLLKGLHNPQTVDGNIVVNGIIALTYTEAVDPRVAAAVLAPIRAVYVMQIWRALCL